MAEEDPTADPQASQPASKKTKRKARASNGAAIGGDVSTEGGDFIGRDKHVCGNENRGVVARDITDSVVIGNVTGPVNLAGPPRSQNSRQRDSHTEQQPVKILFLAANPAETARLRIDAESRAIDQALHQAELWDFVLEKQFAVRVRDLQALLLRHQPDILHFSGHGTSTSEIVLEDEAGNAHAVSAKALERLFAVQKGKIRCVVLNACYAEEQAQAIAQQIDCVVGMAGPMRDQSAISFATAFYQTLAYGGDVQRAFESGCLQIELENVSDDQIPKLLALKANPSTLVFVDRGATALRKPR